MSEWEIGPRVARYRVIGSTEAEALTLRLIGADEFEALSIGRAPNGPQVAIIPLDESSREIAEAIVHFPEMVKAIRAVIAAAPADLWSENSDLGRSLHGLTSALESAAGAPL